MNDAAPSWAVRVASGPRDGGGHVTRCLSLAQELSATARVVFVVDHDSDQWHQTIAGHGFDVTDENGVPDRNWAGCIVDGYRFGAADADIWKARCSQLAVIVDAFDAFPGSDLAIAPALASNIREICGVPALAGPGYALLPPRYTELAPYTVRQSVERILISFGLRDGASLTSVALDAIDDLAGGECRPDITIALGRDAPGLDAVRAKLERYAGRGRLVLDAADLLPYYREADLVIGAGGLGLHERMAVGTPSISVAASDRQHAAIDGLAVAGATINAGTAGTLSASTLGTTVLRVARDRTKRVAMSETGQRLVDGLGAKRAAAALHRLEPADRSATIPRNQAGSG